MADSGFCALGTPRAVPECAVSRLGDIRAAPPPEVRNGVHRAE
ncbi:hypothetical protein AB0J43_42195 [Nonomuraea fuscirosea]